MAVQNIALLLIFWARSAKTNGKRGLMYDLYERKNNLYQLEAENGVYLSGILGETHDAYENTRKCGELKLYFSPSAEG